eukprot:TRINITY_DN2295_c0_g1_i18.p1 TRINITY_DN2295_c0_g1~~TRINITY_DN2295_c0_g1_i18.p1  ORF type:complete len:297 (-),score=59.13 TRINITY_DN2295_c0_g1_i18:871-1761(-)
MWASAADELLSRNWALIELPPSTASAVKQLLLSEAAHFFRSPLFDELKEPPTTEHGAPSYRGTFTNSHRSVLFARLAGDGALPCCAQLPSLDQVCVELHEVGREVLVCLEDRLGMQGSTLHGLLEPQGWCEERASILSLFEYKASVERHHDSACPEHVDYSLVTIIPCAAAPGLEVLDLDCFEWKSPEQGSECCKHAVVLAGEVLEYVTRGRIPATTHRVVNHFQEEPRISCPYLLHAAHKANLARWPGEDGDELLVSAAEFVLKSQLAKKSAVYEQGPDPSSMDVKAANSRQSRD